MTVPALSPASLKTASRLPSKPSALIRLALKDLGKVERQKSRYRVAMGAWHEVPFAATVGCNCDSCHAERKNKKCEVCFAGSVMAKTCRAPSFMELSPASFGPDAAKKFLALDWFRRGRIDQGFAELDLAPPPEGVPSRVDVPEYSSDRGGFKRAMRKLASDLARAGA